MQPLSASARVVNGRELIDECGTPEQIYRSLPPYPMTAVSRSAGRIPGDRFFPDLARVPVPEPVRNIPTFLEVMLPERLSVLSPANGC